MKYYLMVKKITLACLDSELGVLAYNSFIIQKVFIFPQFKDKTVQSIRWLFYEVAGKVKETLFPEIADRKLCFGLFCHPFALLRTSSDPEPKP